MMIKLNNYNFLKKTFIHLLCSFSLIFLCFFENNAFSQNNDLQKESSSTNFKSAIKVSKLAKPSLGSLGANTNANNLLGLNIWQNMYAEDITEHLNYLPDTSSSKHLQKLP